MEFIKKHWNKILNAEPIFHRLLLIGGLNMMTGLSLLISLFIAVQVGFFGKIPTKNEMRNVQNNVASEVISIDGKVLGKYFTENRTEVGYHDLDRKLVQALIATEDARYMNHKGIDARSLLRVLFKTILLRKEQAGGGSTLSQQLSKNLFERKRSSMLMMPGVKVREMMIARKFERMFTKEELLAHYFNTVPFGGNVYGVSAASHRFFGKKPKKLKVEESAVLVGMLKANSSYNPRRNPEKALSRRNVVLRQMLNENYLTKVQYDSLKALPLVLNFSPESHRDGLAPYFREHLRKELNTILEPLENKDGAPYNLYKDGLKIYTTIDSRMQADAEAALEEHMQSLQKTFYKHWGKNKPWASKKSLLTKEMKRSDRYKNLKSQKLSDAAIKKNFNKKVKMRIWAGTEERDTTLSPMDSIEHYLWFLNAGMMAAEAKTGHIKAWVGGINYKYFQYDHTKAKRQVGSTFKPIVYTAALNKGYEPCDYIQNQLRSFIDYQNWTPQNSDKVYGGYYAMKGAIARSVNTVAVDLIFKAGIDNVINLAREMGIDSEIPEVPSIALGTADLSLQEMIQVYSTFAYRGMRKDLVYLLRVEDAEGNVLYKAKPKVADQVLHPSVADKMTFMLEGVVDHGTAKRIRSTYKFDYPIAGKTGTTQSATDGWFMSYTPSLVVGAWVGGRDPSVRFKSTALGQGANTALPICAKFLTKTYNQKVFAKYKRDKFPERDSLEFEMNCEDFIQEKLEPLKPIENIVVEDGRPKPRPNISISQPKKPKRVNEAPEPKVGEKIVDLFRKKDKKKNKKKKRKNKGPL